MNHKIINRFVIPLSPVTAILFVFLLLTDSVTSVELVQTGLVTWYKYMIPSLFPFMVLSGFLQRSGLSTKIACVFSPVLGKVFHLSNNCIYILVMGFLCGFPMGANVIAESLELNKVSDREAELLFSFCNNIGPVYFTSFVVALCPYYPLWISLIIMYGIPFFYGLFLRYTNYRDIPIVNSHPVIRTIKQYKTGNYLISFQESLQKGIASIVTLGGYMIIFNVLQLPLYNSFYKLPKKTLYIMKGLIEINSGISSVTTSPDMFILVYAMFLPFCGLCCFFQTYAMIKNTSLSLKKYFIHKSCQTICTLFVYTVLFYLQK